MRFPVTDHCNGIHFFNPGGEEAPSLREVFWWQMERFFRSHPAGPEAVSEPCLDAAHGRSGGATYLGHSSFLLQGRDWNCLVDPVLSGSVGPGFGFNYRRAEAIPPQGDRLPNPDFVLVTHNHYDHCDSPTLRRLASLPSRPCAVAPLGNGKLLSRMGFKEVIELDWWQSWKSAKGPLVTLTPAVHFSSRGPFDRNRSLWGGFHVDDGKTVYFAAGDTAYGKHYAEVAQRLGSPTLALLPIGASEPTRLMSHIHQGPAEALRAHHDLGAARSCACHFGTFLLADDTLHGPAHEFAALRNKAGLGPESFVIPRPGQTIAAGR